MAKYYFETEFENVLVSDEEGLELVDDHAARAAALRALPDIAKDTIPIGDHRVFTIRVLNETRALVYQGTVIFEGDWVASGNKPTLVR